MAQSKYKKREQRRSCAGSALHPYVQSLAEVSLGAPKTQSGGTAQSSPFPFPSLNHLLLDQKEMGTGKTCLQLLCQGWGSQEGEDVLRASQPATL